MFLILRMQSQIGVDKSESQKSPISVENCFTLLIYNYRHQKLNNTEIRSIFSFSLLSVISMISTIDI